MKKLFLKLSLSLACLLPASAQQVSILGNCDAAIRYAGIPISGLSVPAGQTPSATNVVINFLPTATSDQQTAAQAIVTNFTWNALTPDVQGFEDQIWDSTTLSAAAKMGLVAFFPQVEKYASFRPVSLQQGWLALQSLYGSDWLTTDVITETQNAANAHNVPLVVPATTTTTTGQ